jgi:hypothetical protein
MGLQLVENPQLTVPDGYDVVRRTWRERLFQRPWRPLRATRPVARFKPDPAFYVLEQKMIVAHPVTMAKMRVAMDELDIGSTIPAGLST